MTERNDKQRLNDYLSVYLTLVPPNLARQYAITSLIVPVLFFSYGSFLPPFLPSIAWPLIGTTLIFVIWSLWICIFPYRLQRNYILFVGTIFTFTSFGLIVIPIKFVYFNLGIHVIWYPTFIVIGYPLFALILWKMHLKALYSGVYYREQTGKKAASLKSGGLLSLAVGIALISSQVGLSNYPNYDVSFGVFSCLLQMLGLLFLLGAHNIHKYKLMINHPELVKYYDYPKVSKHK